MTQRRFEEVDRSNATERLIEPLAEADAGGGCVAHRRAEQVVAAQLEKAAVADPMPCRPVEDADRVVLGDPTAQQLARLVPVDQEHQRGAEHREERVAIGRALGTKGAGNEKERVLLAESGRGMAIEPAPFRREPVEQGDKEFCARQMHVAVGHRHGVLLDRNHHDMGIGGADIVLDQKPVAGPHRHGVKAGMVELQRARLFDATHEAFHSRSIRGVQTEGVRAGYDLLRAFGGQSVEELVQVHHQPMQAVGTFQRDGGQSRDARKLDLVRSLELACSPDRGKPCPRRLALGLVSGHDGADHGRGVVGNLRHQARKIGRGEAAPGHQMRAADQAGKRSRRYFRGVTFDRKIGRGMAGLARMVCCRLQRAHPHLDAIVGGNPTAISN